MPLAIFRESYTRSMHYLINQDLAEDQRPHWRKPICPASLSLPLHRYLNGKSNTQRRTWRYLQNVCLIHPVSCQNIAYGSTPAKYDGSKFNHVCLESAVLWLTERLKSDPDYVIHILEEVRLRDIKDLDSIGCDALLGCYENMTGALTSYSWLLEGKVATVGQLIGHPKSKLLSVFQDLASKCGPSIVQTLQDTTTTTLASRRNQGRILRNFVSAAIYFVLVLTENGMPPFQNNVLSSPEFKLAFGQFLYGHIFQSSIFQKKDEIEDILNRPKAKVSKLGSNIAAELLRVLKEKDCKESLEACLNSLASVLFAREGTLQNMVVDSGECQDCLSDN